MGERLPFDPEELNGMLGRMFYIAVYGKYEKGQLISRLRRQSLTEVQEDALRVLENTDGYIGPIETAEDRYCSYHWLGYLKRLVYWNGADPLRDNLRDLRNWEHVGAKLDNLVHDHVFVLKEVVLPPDRPPILMGYGSSYRYRDGVKNTCMVGELAITPEYKELREVHAVR